MKIDVLSKTTLKLTLTAEDMNRNSLCYEALSGEGNNCRRAIGRLLKTDCKPESAAMAEKLLNDRPRLFVEVFKRMDGGCMLYVSALDRRTGKAAPLSDSEVFPLIFATEIGEDLGAACRCLLSVKKQGAKFRSALYYREGEYRLAITPQNTCRSRILQALREYGTVWGEEIAAACTGEYYKLLIEEKGAETGAKLF